MIIVMKPRATAAEIENAKTYVEDKGLRTHLSQGDDVTIIGIIGEKQKIATLMLNTLPGVEKTVHITEKYKMVSREFQPAPTVIGVRGVKIGRDNIAVMAGPCSVENEEQLMAAAAAVKKAGAQFLRGGAFKPRTSPYDFQGLGEDGLKLLAQAAKEYDLRVITEIVDLNDVDLVCRYADVLQIGARNMQNFRLLQAVGVAKKPVMLKRGLSATISEWLNAAEYIVSGGNEDVMLCERGIRTYETYTRNTLDLAAVPAVKELSHLPIIVDPSHGTGRRSLIHAMSKAALAAGADGLIIEVHPCPECALSDGDQSLRPEQFTNLMEELKNLAAFMGKKI